MPLRLYGRFRPVPPAPRRYFDTPVPHAPTDSVWDVRGRNEPNSTHTLPPDGPGSLRRRACKYLHVRAVPAHRSERCVRAIWRVAWGSWLNNRCPPYRARPFPLACPHSSLNHPASSGSDSR